MTITLDDLAWLSSDEGVRVLARLADEDLREEQTLWLITALRRELSVSQAAAALEQAVLRKKAVRKFGDDASKLYFTRDALEQASDPLIRQWRAVNYPAETVVDACCGIGADSIAFAQADCQVYGLDIDPVRVAMARLNAEAVGVKARFEVADVRDSVPEADLIFFDPARRDNGKRIFDVEHYQPPLSTIRGWQAGRITVKLSPGVDLTQLQPYVERGMSLSFVSVDGELKEAVLSIDPSLATSRYQAELLNHRNPSAQALVYAREMDEIANAPISEPKDWLVEPDPSIIRAGLVANLANDLGGAQLDPEIAYITTDAKPETPWGRAWKIIDWMPFNLKKLKAYLRERNVGTVTVKKRGTAVTPEELIAKLKLNGNGSRTIVLTRCRGEHVILICEDVGKDLTIEWGG